MILIIIFFINFGLSLVRVDSVPEQDECGGPLSTTDFDDIGDACDYYARCTQPTHKLNANCILLSCPLLSGVCPLHPNGSVNNIATNSAVSILNACIGQDILICGINMSHTPAVQLSWTTKNILPPDVVNGTVHHYPGNGYLDNLSKTTFTLIQTNNPIGTVSIHIRAPYITMNAHLNCTFNFTENSFALLLKRQLTSLTTANTPDSFIFPEMFCTYTNAISSLVAFHLSTFSINILDDQSDIAVLYSNFVAHVGSKEFSLPKSMVDKFNVEMQNYVKKSEISSTAINFLSTFVAQGLKAAQFNCP